MHTVSKYMDQDLASGRIVKVMALTRYNGHTYVDTQWDNGEYWVYLDAELALATGEIARQRYSHPFGNLNETN